MSNSLCSFTNNEPQEKSLAPFPRLRRSDVESWCVTRWAGFCKHISQGFSILEEIGLHIDPSHVQALA